MARIDFEAKTDRELLMLVAQRSNETCEHLSKINSTIIKHEKRITSLEALGSCNTANKSGHKSTLRDKWPTLSMLASVLALIVIEVVQRVQ